jgi:hypothetical protein
MSTFEDLLRIRYAYFSTDHYYKDVMYGTCFCCEQFGILYVRTIEGYKVLICQSCCKKSARNELIYEKVKMLTNALGLVKRT